MYVCMYVCVCMCVCMYVCMYVGMYVCVCMDNFVTLKVCYHVLSSFLCLMIEVVK